MIWATTLSPPRPTTAELLWPTLASLFGGSPPVRLRCWDGSEAGPPGQPTLILRDRHALRRLAWQPGELGLARAYIAGELDVDDDLTGCLRLLRQAAGQRGPAAMRLPAGSWAETARTAIKLGIVGPPPRPPASEAPAGSRSDRAEPGPVGRHHALRPEFCQLVLGPQLAHSAALWAPGCQDLTNAQAAELDVTCARLGLRPGGRLLDVGCGWGALAIHAAYDYRARVTAVTRSGEQAAFARRRVAGLGIAAQVSFLVRDFREISVPPQDAIAIELGELLGCQDLAASCDQLRGQLRPGGRLLIQQLSHASAELGFGPFIDRYIAPDLHIRPVSETISALERAGLEITSVTAMRRDFTTTVHAWQRNLERRWDDAVAMVGAEQARVWRLCLAGLALAFEEGRMGVHQVVAVAPRVRATSSTARRRTGAMDDERSAASGGAPTEAARAA